MGIFGLTVEFTSRRLQLGRDGIDGVLGDGDAFGEGTRVAEFLLCRCKDNILKKQGEE